MGWPRNKVLLQSLTLLLIVTCFILLQENWIVSYKQRSVNDFHKLDFNDTDRELCEVVQIVISALTEDDRMRIHTTLKSLFYHSRSTIFSISFIATKESRFIVETLMKTWQLSYVNTQVYEIEQVPDDLDYLTLMTSASLSDLFANGDDDADVIEIFIVTPKYIFLQNIITIRNSLQQLISQEEIGYVGVSYEDDVKNAGGLVYLRLNHTFINNVNVSCDYMDNDQDTEVLIDDWLRCCICQCSNASLQPSFQPVPMSWSIIGSSNDIMYRNWINFDGNLLITMPHSCVDIIHTIHQLKDDDMCHIYRYHSELSKRTHVSFISSAIRNATSPVTLVTQLMLNRLRGLERLLMAWSGPASVAIYLSDEELPKFVEFYRSSSRLRSKPSVSFHVIFKRQKYFPINYLRNIAMQQVRTEFQFMIDVDFVPNEELAQNAINAFTSLQATGNQRIALVVPTFETTNYSYKIAANRNLFLKDIQQGQVLSYHQKAKWNLGHRYTDYDKWKKTTEPYKVYGAFGYEPYLVIRGAESPLYPEVLLERMRDKLPYTVEVQMAGLQLYVLPVSFAVHLPHPQSSSHKYQREDTDFAGCTSLLYQQVLREITTKYPNSKAMDIISKHNPAPKKPARKSKRKKKATKIHKASISAKTPANSPSKKTAQQKNTKQST